MMSYDSYDMNHIVWTKINVLYTRNARSFFRSWDEFKLIWFNNFGFEKVPFWVTWHVCLYNH